MSSEKPFLSIPEQIHIHALAMPEKTAIVAGGQRLSYAQLDELSDRLAWALKKYGYAKETIIGLFLEQTHWVVVVELGIQKAGLACMSLTKNYPDERIRYCMQNAASPLLITDEARDFSGEGFQTVSIQDLLAHAEPVALEYPKEKDLLVCLYTSGSTGVPKGILLEQGNLLHEPEALSCLPYSEIIREDGILVATRFSFVMFFTDVFISLCNGKTICIPTIEELKNSEALLTIITREKVKTLVSTPSLVETLVTHPEAKEAFCRLQVISVAGEAISLQFVHAVFEVHPKVFLLNSYGSTETCVISAMRLQLGVKRISAGKAIAGTELLIVDDEGQILPSGQKGNLLVSGPCVMRGYLNRDSENVRVFTEINGKRFFRTGDIALMNEKGELDVAARNDDVVKYHGQRVDLKEIEKVALSFPGLRSCFAHLKETDLRLFFTAERKIALAELSAHLHSYLPDYMVPSVVYQLEKMPLNTHGKIDRTALQAMEIVSDGEAPKTEGEKKLCAIIGKILGCKNLNVTDSLFSLGLSSLSAMRFCAALPHALNLSVADIKETTSIRDLAQQIEKSQRNPITQRKYGKQDFYPLLANQRGLYVEWSKEPDSLKYNLPCVVSFPNLSADCVEEALRKLIAKHPIITARIVVHNGELVLKPGDADDFALSKQSLEHEPEDSCFQSLLSPFNLNTGKLSRFALYKYPTGCTLFADFHHIIFDGYSRSLFTRDLLACLEGKEIPRESMTLFDYSLAEKELPFEQAKAYFAALTQDATPFSLPALAQEEVSPSRRQEATLVLGKIRSFCSQHTLSLSGYFHAVFALIVGRLSRDNHPLFLSAQNGRSHTSLANTIGMFAQTVPFVVEKEADKVVSFIRKVERQLAESQEFNFYSYPRFVEDQKMQGEVFFVYQGELLQDKCVRDISIENESPLFPIVFELSLQKDDTLRLSLSYDGKRYSQEMMSGLLEGYLQLAETMHQQERVADCCLVRNLPQLLSISRGPVLEDDTSKTWVDLFVEQREKRPNNLAVADEDSEMSYAELDILSNKVASFLAKNGVKEGEFVAVALDRRKEFLAVLLGIHKAGAAYVPIDLEFPEERIAFICNDCETKLVITDELLKEIVNMEECRPVNRARPEGKAYMVYTSGTTGQPKGVVIQHKALLNYIYSACRLFPLTEHSRVAVQSNFSFDLSIADIFPVLTRGGSEHILSQKTRKDIALTKAFLKSHAISSGVFTTSFAQILGSEEELALETLVMGGEAMSSLPHVQGKVLNIYGPTEFTVMVTALEVNKENQTKRFPIGRPFANCATFVVDSANQLLPLGLPGELCLAGPQMAEGYWKLPEKTAQVFSSIMVGEESCPVYHTGDFALWNQDGQLEYLGRIDTQVKIRGFRIELGEIESWASKFPGILLAAALVKKDNIALYFSATREIARGELQAFLREKLPSYMVPVFFQQLKKLPQNHNGKIDRQALSALEFQTDMECIAPATYQEETLFGIASQILGHTNFGVTDSLLSLGMSSLSAMRFCAELPHALNLSMADIKESTSIRDLAQQIEQSQRTQITHRKYKKRDFYPLLENQRGLYVEWSKKPASLLYHIPFSLSFPDLSASRLEEALRKVIAKHPIIAARIVVHNGEPVLKPDDTEKINLIKQSLEHEPEEAFFQSLLAPFNLNTGELARFALIASPTGCTLFADFHHIIFDGYSRSLFTRDLLACLEGKEIPEESLSIFDYSLAEKELPFEQAKAYFASLAQNATSFSLPATTEADGILSGTQEASLSLTKIRAFCRQQRLSLSGYFHAVFALTIGRLSRDKHPLFLTLQNGRSHTSLANTIGMFVQTVPFVVEKEAENVVSFIRAVERQLEATQRFNFYSYSQFVEDQKLQGELLFIYQGELLAEKSKLTPTTVFGAERQNSIFPIVFEVSLGKDQTAHLSLSYDGKRYGQRTIAAFLDGFTQVAETMCCQEQLADLCLVKDVPQLVSRSKGEVLDYDRSKTWVDLFLAQKDKTPDNLAVADDHSEMSYAELERFSNKVAGFLCKKGICEGDFVAVALGRKKEFSAVILGVHKIGAAYVPLDSSLPEQRRAFILKNSGAKIVITDEMLEEVFATEPCEGINKARPEGRAYIIYTSGTTGIPKGVVIRHSSLLNFIQWVCSYWSVNEHSRSAVHSNFSFDVSIEALFPVLTRGGSLHISPKEALKDISLAKQFFKKHAITSVLCSTSVGKILGAGEELNLDYFAVIGEAMTFIPKVRGRIFNMYGPTEFTDAITSFEVSKTTNYKSIPIGRPLANCAAFIVDSANRLLPQGLAGELCLAGPQMAEGYWNLPERTAEAFSSIMLGKEFCPIYHTGDFAYWNNKYQLEFIGRIDAQVKVRGFRVELGEIESWATKFPEILLAAAIVKKDKLSLFFTARQKIEIPSLQGFLGEKLPSYMVPSFFHQMDVLPLTVNGKRDRAALATLEIQRHTENVAPATEQEKRLLALTSEILGYTNFGVTDNLFSLGMSSLDAMRLCSEISMREGVNVLVSPFLQNPNLRNLASLMERDSEDSFPRQELKRRFYPLMANQLDFVANYELHPLCTQYNICAAIPYHSVSGKKLVEAIKKVITAHPILKSRLVKTKEGILLQRCDEEDVFVPYIPLSENPTRDFFRSQLRPFNIYKERLYRITVYEGPSETWLFQDIHHIIFDGLSAHILHKEIQAALKGEEIHSEEISCFDLALYEESQANSKKFREAKRYFDELTRGISPLCLSLGTKNDGVAVAHYSKTFPVANITAFCASQGITVNSFFHAVFASLVHRVTGNEAFLYISVDGGRGLYLSLHRSLGFFSKAIPVVFKNEQGASPAHLAAFMQAQLQKTYSMNVRLFVEQDMFVTNVLFSFRSDLHKQEGMSFSIASLNSPRAFFEVHLFQDEYELWSAYNGMHYHKDDIKRFFAAFGFLAEAFCTAEKIQDIVLPSREEETTLLQASD